jgi:hypothetical protein
MMPRQCGYQDDAHNPFCAGYDFREEHLMSAVALRCRYQMSAFWSLL